MNLAYEVGPDELSFTVENDARLDRYKRLMRIYLFFHELGHVVYRSKAGGFEKVDDNIQRAIAAFQTAGDDGDLVERSPGAQARVDLGLSIPMADLPSLYKQIEADMGVERTREEIWCDAFAATFMLDWAVDQGIDPIECYAVDALLHLFVGARFQWLSFWDRSNTLDPWDTTKTLASLEARVFIRSLIMYAECFHRGRDTGFASSVAAADEKTQLAAYHQLTDEHRDHLLDRYHARINLALGLLNLLDRSETLKRAENGWDSLSPLDQSQMIDDLLHDLS